MVHQRVRAAVVFAAPALLVAVLVHAPATPAQAASAPIKTFANCDAMHRVPAYRGGIKKVGAVDRRASGTARYKPYVSTARYKLNIARDRDKDGVACER